MTWESTRPGKRIYVCTYVDARDGVIRRIEFPDAETADEFDECRRTKFWKGTSFAYSVAPYATQKEWWSYPYGYDPVWRPDRHS